MRFTRPLLVAASTLALLISACSTSDDFAAPTLNAQFGTAREDSARVVATDAQRGRIYLAGTSYTASEPFDETVFFRRYNRDGGLAWEREPNAGVTGLPIETTGADTDGSGNVVYTWNSREGSSTRGFVTKYNPSGTRMFQLELPGTRVGGTAIDGTGSIYVTAVSQSTTSKKTVRKYTSSGKLAWKKVLTEADVPELAYLNGLDVAADGALYVAAETLSYGGLLLKLRSSDGKLLKVSDVRGDVALDVAIGGGAVYVLSDLDAPFHFEPLISRFRADGSEVWVRRGFFSSDENQDNLRYEMGGGLGADAQGNAYFTGVFVTEGYSGADGFHTDVFVRKYTPSGSVAFNKRFAVNPNTNTNGNGVAAASANELYVVGSSNGEVNGRNKGGRDAFLLRLNGQGAKVWSR